MSNGEVSSDKNHPLLFKLYTMLGGIQGMWFHWNVANHKFLFQGLMPTSLGKMHAPLEMGVVLRSSVPPMLGLFDRVKVAGGRGNQWKELSWFEMFVFGWIQEGAP